MASAKTDPIRVLVVDDSETMRASLAGMLEDFAYHVAAAVDGQDGMDAFGRFHPDIVLLDMNMPRLDGLGVIRRIRLGPDDQGVFIIMITADQSPGLKLRAFAAGADDYLDKPFDRTELLARVAVAARHVRQGRRLRSALAAIGQEIDQVSSLQARLLPGQSPDLPGVAIRSLYRPSGKASGDYFDHFPLPGGGLRAVVADVSGHGARAAFLMAIVRTLVRFTQTHYMALPDIFSLLNSHLRDIIGPEPDFVTMLGVDVDFRARRLAWVNAGHCPGLLRRDPGRVERLDPTATVLGFFETGFPQAVTALDGRATLFMFTDGFYDRRPASGRVLDFDAFWDLAVAQAARPGDFLDNLLAAMGDGAREDGPARDDLTALWLDLRPEMARPEMARPEMARPEMARPEMARPGEALLAAGQEPAGPARTYNLDTQAEPDAARRAVRAAMSILGDHVADPAALYELDLALTEACANVVRHAYGPQRVGSLEVSLAVEPGSHVAVEVADRGRGFRVGPDFMREPAPSAESGRGLYIISKLMDRIDIISREGKNILAFRKDIGKEAWKGCA